MNLKERIKYLSGSFEAFPESAESGFLFGTADMDGRRVYICGPDREKHTFDEFKSIALLTAFLETAAAAPAPFILLMDIPGSHEKSQKSHIPSDPDRLLADRSGVGAWYHGLARLSGRAPTVCAVFDRLGAALTFPVSLCDVTVMTAQAGMSIGREDIVSGLTRENIDYERLGGAMMHYVQSGSADAVFSSEKDVLDYVKKYIGFMPFAGGMPLPQSAFEPGDAPLPEIPDNPVSVMDMDGLISALADRDSVLELKGGYAREVITCFASFEGKKAGIIANRSKEKGGLFFPQSSRKAAVFVSLCDSFGIPIVFLSDSAGFMVGSQAEQSGNIRSGAMLFQSIATSVTARMCVVIRRGYTAGLYAMSGGGMRPDRFVALPTAVMTIYGEAVTMMLMAATTPQEKQNAEKMLGAAGSPELFYEKGMLDAVVSAENLKSEIVQFISRFQDGKRASVRPVPVL